MEDQMLWIIAIKKLGFSFWLLLTAFAVQESPNAHKMNDIKLWLVPYCFLMSDGDFFHKWELHIQSLITSEVQ